MNQHVTAIHCTQHILMLSSQIRVKSSKTQQQLKWDKMVITCLKSYNDKTSPARDILAELQTVR